MDECIFCKIVKGDIPSAKLYEDEDFIAILDLYPVSKGHSLLIPKRHCRNIFDTPAEVGERIYPLLTKLSNALSKALKCDGLNIVQNNEEIAGQVVFHSHIHLIPRYNTDGIRLFGAGKTKASEEEMKSITLAVRGELK